MDKRLRVVELAARLPEFLREIPEFQQLTETEDQEFRRFYENSDGLWEDGFILQASAQGIRRWESILGMLPDPKDSLEDRRAAVLARWNQQLPYTLRRLKEALAAFLGSDGFAVYTAGFSRYQLGVDLINQSDRTYLTVKDMLLQWIPANMELILRNVLALREETRIFTGACRQELIRICAQPEHSDGIYEAEVMLETGAGAYTYYRSSYQPERS